MSERWKPKHGDRYWVIDACYRKGVRPVNWVNDVIDNTTYSFGDCFKTEAEAQVAAEKVKALLLSLHEPTTTSSQLPKLTAEVFDRPAKLPAWCKVDALCWHKRCSYFKVTYIDDYSKHVSIQQVEDKSKGYLSFHTVCNEVVQARPRPYNEYEMEALVGKAIKTPDGNVYICTAYQKPTDAHEAVVDVDAWISAAGLLEDGYTIDGSPCGKLEHLNEKGEWVK